MSFWLCYSQQDIAIHSVFLRAINSSKNRSSKVSFDYTSFLTSKFDFSSGLLFFWQHITNSFQRGLGLIVQMVLAWYLSSLAKSEQRSSYRERNRHLKVVSFFFFNKKIYPKFPIENNIYRGNKCTLLSERRQSEKTAYCVIPTIWCSRKGKIMPTVKRSVVARG